MSNLNTIDSFDVYEMMKIPKTKPDFIIDGMHFGRGDEYYDEIESNHLKHTTIKLKCWRIINENLEEIEDKNIFYDSETYIIQWDLITKNNRTNIENENRIYFYWKGIKASKGYSPLPESIEKENPPVERIVQWAEPPAFLQLFQGSFIVNSHKNNEPHLYILRGELDNEVHLYEVPLKTESLRSRTSFVVYSPEENSSIIWDGSKSNSHCKNSIRKITQKVFGSNFVETGEGDEEFLQFLSTEGEYFMNPFSKILDYTPRLFYLNKITGNFSAIEVECCHKSTFLTPFPFLQTHLYTADQPATFLLDDHDEIWIWQGWGHEQDDDFKSECFTVAIKYAKEKSKQLKKLVKLQKVIAGFEPIAFTNLFPTWTKREDVAEIQVKEGALANANTLIEVVPQEDAKKI